MANPNVKRVTVLRQLGGVGDVLMLTPVFRGLKELYGPKCKITVGTSWNYYGGALPLLFRYNPFIDTIVRVEPHEFAPWCLKYSRWDFRGVPNTHPPNCVEDTDLVMDLNTVCSIVESREQPNVRTHRTDIWCQAAGVTPSCKKPILVLTETEREEGRAWCDQNFGPGLRVGIQLRAHDPTRTWPFSERMAFRLKEDGYQVCTFDIAKRLSNDIPSPLGFNIRQVAAVVENLDAVIAPDSGLLHLAGTMGTPVLGLFGSTDPEMRMREYAGHYTIPKKLIECGPCWYTKPCLKSNDKNDWVACMRRISVDHVMNELEVMLRRFGKLGGDKCQPSSVSWIPMDQLLSPV